MNRIWKRCAASLAAAIGGVGLALSVSCAGQAHAATASAGSTATPGTSAGQTQTPGTAAPLALHSLDSPGTGDPFPAVNPKNFTANSPTVDAVNAFLKQLWGYDSKRLWRVAAIQSTPATGVSHVTVLVTEKGSTAKVQPTAFYVLPDGKHAIAGDSIMNFGARPFAETRARLAAEADGPWRGSASKQLELVEFADMQCPHCKDAQTAMEQLARDFPNAHIVYQSFPIAAIHPFATKAAVYGECIAQQKPEAFWTYLQAVYDTQGGLTAEDGDKTLATAVTKAGMDPGAIAICAATPEAQAKVLASVKLAEAVGVDQTPTLAVNGRLVPVSPAAMPYETLKEIVQFQAAQDGVK